MVKAGVYTGGAAGARRSGRSPAGRYRQSSLGLLTMVVGGWRSLRRLDLKLILAFGTVQPRFS